MAAVRSLAAGAAAAPRARHHQRPRLRAGRAGDVRDPARPSTPIACWDRLASGEVTVFTAVPTIYSRSSPRGTRRRRPSRRRRSDGVRTLRLMMSGSAALPVHVLERWREISGHTLLERYGMTEIGMALSNPLDGERRPGLRRPSAARRGGPSWSTRTGIDGRRTGSRARSRCRAPTVFREYWQRPEETTRGLSRRLVPHRRHGGRRGRLLPHARPHQRGHHQDRRLQGVGPRDRGGAPDARRHRRVRGRRRGRRRVGRTRVGGRRAEAGSRRSSWATCRPGRGRGWRRTRFPARCRWSARCRGMPWARW